VPFATVRPSCWKEKPQPKRFFAVASKTNLAQAGAAICL
jgi:hypothetical protein